MIGIDNNVDISIDQNSNSETLVQLENEYAVKEQKLIKLLDNTGSDEYRKLYFELKEIYSYIDSILEGMKMFTSNIIILNKLSERYIQNIRTINNPVCYNNKSRGI